MSGYLDTWSGFAPKDTSTTRGKNTQIAPTGHQSRHTHRIISRSVHEAKSSGLNRFGILVNGLQWRLPRLCNGSKTFFINGRQASFLVAMRWVVINGRSEFRCIVLPPMNHVDQTFAHFGRRGTLSQQVLGTVYLAGFCQNGRTTLLNQTIRSHPQGRIGRDATMAIGTSAVHGQGQITDGTRRPS